MWSEQGEPCCFALPVIIQSTLSRGFRLSWKVPGGIGNFCQRSCDPFPRVSWFQEDAVFPSVVPEGHIQTEQAACSGLSWIAVAESRLCNKIRLWFPAPFNLARICSDYDKGMILAPASCHLPAGLCCFVSHLLSPFKKAIRENLIFWREKWEGQFPHQTYQLLPCPGFGVEGAAVTEQEGCVLKWRLVF